jgi:chromosome segregation ATPase
MTDHSDDLPRTDPRAIVLRIEHDYSIQDLLDSIAMLKSQASGVAIALAEFKGRMDHLEGRLSRLLQQDKQWIEELAGVRDEVRRQLAHDGEQMRAYREDLEKRLAFHNEVVERIIAKFREQLYSPPEKAAKVKVGAPKRRGRPPKARP